VAVGLDLIVAKEMGLRGLLNFNKANEPPQRILERRLETEFRNLEMERVRDYPSERQLDGLILSVSYVGIVGNPEEISHLQSFMIGCRPGTPIARELEVVRARMDAIH
jgi:hypothetical protein